jgi:hypothetical protein
MAAQNAAEKRAKARQMKQKRLLFVLVPVLIALMIFTVPRTLKQLRGEKAASSSPAAATVSPPVDPTTGAAGGAATPAATTDPTAIAASAKAILVDTDQQPEASEGQLYSFSRFDARDPFVPLVEDEAADTSATDASGAVPTTTVPTVPTVPTTPTTPSTTTGGSNDYTQAPATKVNISVNGDVQVLAVGDAFPGNDPAFKLVSIGADSVEIGLVSGTFSTGVNTITVKVGEPVTLIGQPDGARYTIKLLGPA